MVIRNSKKIPICLKFSVFNFTKQIKATNKVLSLKTFMFFQKKDYF